MSNDEQLSQSFDQGDDEPLRESTPDSPVRSTREFATFLDIP